MGLFSCVSNPDPRPKSKKGSSIEKQALLTELGRLKNELIQTKTQLQSAVSQLDQVKSQNAELAQREQRRTSEHDHVVALQEIRIQELTEQVKLSSQGSMGGGGAQQAVLMQDYANYANSISAQLESERRLTRHLSRELSIRAASPTPPQPASPTPAAPELPPQPPRTPAVSARMVALEQEVQDQRNRMAELTQQLEAEQQRSVELQQRLTAVAEEAAAAQAARDAALRAEYEQHANSLASFAAEKEADILCRLATSDVQLATLQQQHDAKAAAAAAAAAERAALAAQIEAAAAREAEAQRQIKDLKECLANGQRSWSEEKEQMLRTLVAQEEEIHKLQNQMQDMQAAHRETQAAAAAASTAAAPGAAPRGGPEHEELAAQLAALQAAHEALLAGQSKLQQELQQQQQARADAEADANELHEELRAQKAIYDSTITEMSMMMADMGSLKEKYNQLERSTRHHHDMVALVESELIDLAGEGDLVLDDIQEMVEKARMERLTSPTSRMRVSGDVDALAAKSYALPAAHYAFEDM